MTGAGPFSITYNTNGYDTTFQTVGTGAFADSMFIIVRVFDLRLMLDLIFLLIMYVAMKIFSSPTLQLLVNR